MTEAEISTLRREGIAVNYNNEPAHYNFMQYDNVLPIPSSLTSGFHDVDPWRQSGKFSVGRAILKMIPNPRIQQMSRLYFFMEFYFMDYINYVVIPDTNKHLNLAMNFSDYFLVIGCRLIVACYVGHSVRHLFLKDPITPYKGAPICLNHIITRRHAV